MHIITKRKIPRLYKVNINTGETVPVAETDNLNYYKISSYLQDEAINVFSLL